MPRVDHLLDHQVHAQPQLLDVTPLEQTIDDARVAREVLVHDVVDGDEAGQAAGAGDLQPVGEHPYFDGAPAHAIVAVGDGVDQRLADGAVGGYCHCSLRSKPRTTAPDADFLLQNVPRALDDLRQRAVELHTPSVPGFTIVLAHVRAVEADEGQPAARDEGLRIACRRAGYRPRLVRRSIATPSRSRRSSRGRVSGRPWRFSHASTNSRSISGRSRRASRQASVRLRTRRWSGWRRVVAVDRR